MPTSITSSGITFDDATTQTTSATKAGGIGTTQIANSSVTQAKLASNVAGNGPAFSAYANTGTTVANGGFAKITLGVERFDTNNNFASSRFTPTVAGYYQINGAVYIASGANYLLAIVIKNGTNIPAGQWGEVFYGTYGQAVTSASSVSALVYLNGTTDYVELAGYQASGTSATISDGITRMDGFLARAA